MEACGQRFTPEVVGRIEAAVVAEPSISRRDLSRRVCQWLDWRGPNGRLKDMSCRVALKRLESRGIVRLPPARRAVAPAVRSSCTQPIGAIVEGSLADVGPVELVLVGGRESTAARVWRGLMEQDHPHGAGPLCGAQLRYLIRSPQHGWLGGLSFSSAAWRLEARDRWIGWTEGSRRAHLPKVVSNSRFLIRPEVRVPHLASHVLARCLRRLPQDWQARYGVEPVLAETFVEVDRYAGTSYRAANWQHIGESRGRGRQDRGHRTSLPVKHLYVYPLHRRWREALCELPAGAVPPPPVCGAPPRRDRSPPADWADEEFGRATLGDARLTKRLLGVARDFFGKPQANIPQACGSRARTKATYRFFDHPGVTMDVVLPSHIEATRERLRAHRVVLAVQDTTTLNYTAHPATDGLGPLGSIDDLAAGLLVHDTMAFTVDGTPLGLLDIQCWARDGSTQGQGDRRKRVPIEQKESAKWLRSYRHVAEAQREAPDTMLVSVGDREADLYELFAEAALAPSGPKLLVRAERSRNRKVGQGLLWDRMAAQPVAGFQQLHVPRKGSRPARTARLAVRFAAVELQPPKGSSHPPVPVWAVYAHEVDYAPHLVKEPLSWMLLTTVATTSFDQACERLAWYAKRWGIEVYHRTLKSGCRIENRQLATAKRLEACLAIDLVVAWRVFHLAKLGRDLPNTPCTVYFQDAEWKALSAFVTRNPVAPEKPPSLRTALRWVAGLGGFLGRKGDGEPGTQTLWLGLQRLDDITSIWCVFAGVPQLRSPTVSSHDEYG